MSLIVAATIISFVLSGLAQTLLRFQPLLKQRTLELSFLLSSHSVLPSGFLATLPFSQDNRQPLEEIDPNICRSVPIGLGIPGFQPGLHKNDVIRMFGVPSKTSSGYWPNTSALSYDLIPKQVSLGFLFDRNSERIRQTEASFTNDVDSQMMLVTVNGMLGCQMNEQIKQGLKQVWERQSTQYFFNVGCLQGVIQRDKRDRVYVGIWEEDLH